MPRGGFRVGAGRKPFRAAEKAAKAARADAAKAKPVVVDGPGQVWPFPDDQCRVEPPVVEASKPDPVPVEAATVPRPPVDYAALVAGVERVLRPLALAEGTLVPATEFEFQALCQLAVEQARALQAFQAEGFTEFGLKLERAYRGLTQRLETKLRSFKLAPFGKEIVPAQAAKPKSALEQLKERAKSLRAVG
jgi:hypothetical protein